jgi:protein SCO1/2
MGHASRLIVASVAGMAIIVMMTALLTFASVTAGSQTPGSVVGGAFNLTDQDGRQVTEQDLLGKPSMVFFGFTSCPDVCPTTLLEITNWLGQLGADGDKLNVVFVSVDSEQDTSERMKLYLSSFDPRIRGFVGTEAQIQKIADGYGVHYKRVAQTGGGYTYTHSVLVYLMDSQGRYVGFLRYEEPDAEAVARLRRLISIW